MAKRTVSLVIEIDATDVEMSHPQLVKSLCIDKMRELLGTSVAQALNGFDKHMVIVTNEDSNRREF